MEQSPGVPWSWSVPSSLRLHLVGRIYFACNQQQSLGSVQDVSQGDCVPGPSGKQCDYKQTTEQGEAFNKPSVGHVAPLKTCILNHPRCNPHNGRHSAAAPMLKHCAVSMWLFMSVPHQWLFMPCLCRLCRLGGSKAITRIQWTWAETGGYLSCFESSPQTQSDDMSKAIGIAMEL